MKYVVVEPNGNLNIIDSIGRDDAPNMDDMKCSAEVTGYAHAIFAVDTNNVNDVIITNIKSRGDVIYMPNSDS